MIRTMAFALGALSFAASHPASAATPIAGRWVTEDKSALVDIAPCGNRLCGTIIRFLTPPKGGPDPRDVNNADPAKRSRRILGLAILTGFAPAGDEWKGQIYDPRSGKTYRSVLVRTGNSLAVKGCLNIFCKTQTWTRGQ
jgi:uncharacterized protein (DUF2147 family)